jgi:hypothetical protein
MPEPSTTEGRRIQGELKGLLEDAAVRRAESSTSRRQGCPSKHRATPSRRVREASVRTERTRDGTPESRLEGGGGVNRANLKFINLNTTTSRVSIRNMNESEREGKNKSQANKE